MSAANEAIPFLLNRDKVEEKAAPGVVLLDTIRRARHLTGTKEACREGDCGACMVLLGTPDASSLMHYVPVNSCLLPLGEVEGAVVQGLGWIILEEVLYDALGACEPIT